MDKTLKVVTTEMSEHSIVVVVSIYPPIGGAPDQVHSYEFPVDVVNPRVALQIATLLVSDPTIPSSDEKEKK